MLHSRLASLKILRGNTLPASHNSTEAPTLASVVSGASQPSSSTARFWGSASKPVFLLFWLPVIVTCLLCIGTFIMLHNQHREVLYANYQVIFLEHLQQQLSSKNTQPLNSEHQQELNQNHRNSNENVATNLSLEDKFNDIAKKYLKTGFFTNLSLLNSDREVIHYVGLPNNIAPKWGSTINPSGAYSDGTTIVLAIPHAEAPEYWLAAKIDKSPSSILFLKTLLWGVGCSLLAIVIATALSIRCQQQMIMPLQRLNSELRKAMNGCFGIQFTQPDTTVHAQLVASVQQLLDMNRGLREGTQKYIEQATQDIRETLETVEIQNIELDIARKHALRASADKSELLASTSHEIRTPLNGILGFTHLLLKTELNDQQKDYLATIEQSAQGLLTVINDIIDYARLETGTITFEYKPLNVRSIITDVLQTRAPSANENHLRLIQHISPNMPSQFLGDPLRLKQVLNNLTHGLIAIEASGNLIIESKALQQNNSKMQLSFSIRNPAAQASKEQQMHINMALSNSATDAINDATCLGLTIAKTLIERMGGELSVNIEKEGVGFHFTLELGYSEEADNLSSNETIARNRTNNTSPLTALESPSQHRDMVIYDSNPFSRQELILSAKAWGIEPISESEIHKLPDTIKRTHASLVILDYVTSGRRFHKNGLLDIINELLLEENLQIALVAPSHVQRQLEEELIGKDVYFITRPIEYSSLSHVLQRITGPQGHNHYSAHNSRQEQLNILVADDNPANSKLVCAFLQGDNHNITVVDNGKKALESYLQKVPDIIFMDVQMPEMDGLDATKAIRNRETPPQRVPIVALTANTLSEQRTRILVAGMDDYLTKPVSDEDLRHTLRRWVKSPAQAQQPVIEHDSVNPDALGAIGHTDDQIAPSPDKLGDGNPQKKVFSLEKSLELTKGNRELAKDMLEMMLKELPEYQHTLASALKQPPVEDFSLEEQLHKLKGGAAYTGLVWLHEAATHVESALNDNQYTPKLEALLRAIRETHAFFDNIDIDALFQG